MANDALEAENSADISKVESESVSFSKLWEEVKDWRTNWTWVGFFKALLLGLAASFFDSATDFNFPWSVPVDCANTTLASKAFKVAYIFSTCGLMFYKNVQRLTFTFIAYPGFLFALGDHGITGLVKRCWGTKAQGLVGKLGHVLAVILELSTCIALLGAAMWSDRWEKNLPNLALAYDFTLQGMAYLSAAIVLGIKCLGVFSHGPGTKRFIHNATITETKFEAALQLTLLSGLSLTTGTFPKTGSMGSIAH